jgi:DNA invertase Pin-like site-specific DNA recombinase
MAPRLEGKNPEQGPIRCAIYARYSSDMQRPTSIEDQIRECRDAAARNGWVVLDQYIRGDEALSGETTGGRDWLENLISLAQQKPRPFDYILMDDTSRFGRNLSDTLPMSDILEYAGV